MKVVAALLSYPPHRFIGSELMTHALLKRLQSRGHDVVVVGKENTQGWVWDGIRVVPRPLPEGDVLIYHAEFWQDAEESRPWVDRWVGPKVAVCHNSRIGVEIGLMNCPPTLAVVNSLTMEKQIRHPRKVVVHPPVPDPVPVHGDAVTVINMEATSKIGPFWDVAKRLRPQPFLGVKGGYGQQDVRRYIPKNVTVIDQVSPLQMRDEVWARTRILMVPSETESWSMVASEAMAHGIPVIANPTPGLQENLDGVGLWANRYDTEQWVYQIQFLLSTWDEHSAVALTRAALQREQHAVEADEFCRVVEALC